MPALPTVSPPKHIARARNPPGATFGPRHLHDFEFVWMTEGNATYRYDGHSVDVSAGAVVLCRAGWRDEFLWDTRRPSRHVCVHFDIPRIPGGKAALDRWPIVVMPEPGDLLRTSLQHLLGWSGRGDAGLCRQVLRTALGCFINGEVDTARPPRDDLPDAVQRVIEHLTAVMQHNRATPVTLADLAEVACVTPEHLCRVFTQSVGHSPAAVVRLWRLDRASDLLVRSNASVGQIAEAVGFASQFHFSRRFSAAFGMSPTQLRRDVRAGVTPPLPLLHDVVRVVTTDQ